MASDLPVIDLLPLASPRPSSHRAVAERIGAACREVGFFAVTGHGVPASLIAETFAASRRFFALPDEAKQRLARDPAQGNQGYVGLGVEALDATTAADLKEAFNIVWTDGVTRPAHRWPEVPGFAPTVQAYFDAVLAVGVRLHRAFALDLSLPEDHFARMIDRPLAALRLLRYPGRPADAPPAALGAGTHTDYGNLTLLATDGVAGLQIQRRDGDWIDAPSLPGDFLCNIGDCLMRWTNDVYVSTPHRVVQPAVERHSIAMFLDPNPDAVVRAIPSCVAPGATPKYPPIATADYLASRFAATYGGSESGPRIARPAANVSAAG